MIYTPLTKKALCLCFKAHRDQLDKSGIPYVFHPFHVAESMPDEITTTVALLHDVVEDTDFTFEDLLDRGVDESIVEALRLLTHSKDMPYDDYVQRIAQSGNEIAIHVKYNDLCHNLRRGRAGGYWRIVEKHEKAMAIIEPLIKKEP